MYAFLVDFVNFMRTGHVRYFLLFFVIIWIRWFIVNIPALLYRPAVTKHRARKSVIIPVVDEAPEVFRAVLKSIQRQRPQETIVVINGPKNRTLEKVCDEFKGITRRWTRKPGKRNAIKLGMRYATGDIIVLVDSDTIWEKHMLRELVKPFADPNVGGVTTRQRITNPTQSLLTRVCDWLEDVRTHGTMQAMSVTEKVGCLPGRTIAFRADVLRSVLREFMRETFLGFHKEVSDDRSLTNLTLQAGYKTVLQSTAVVYTEAPTHWKKFLRQQLRWSEGSQYNNIRMSRWMLKNARLMFFIYWTDMLVPFLLWGVYGSYLINYLFFHTRLDADLLLSNHNLFIIIAVTFGGAYISYAMRQLPAINERLSHMLFLPFYLLFLSFVMAPIRMIGFARLADDLGWGTRGGGYTGGKSSKKPKIKLNLRLRRLLPEGAHA
ncbi:MAG TPA: glycosyltransferase family 2 protein [Candidatus Saccharimonadales bacterium]|nr:glycosyltransferase family 2 protein [Candidatus Saccharimonadales bacterium]